MSHVTTTSADLRADAAAARADTTRVAPMRLHAIAVTTFPLLPFSSLSPRLPLTSLRYPGQQPSPNQPPTDRGGGTL